MAREDFDSESGLLSDYDGEVVEAWWAIDEKFGGLRLYLKQTTNSDTVPEITENFSAGANWQSYDGGETATNKDQEDKKKFHENSRIAQLIRRIMDAPEGTSLYQGGDVLDSRATPGMGAREAKIWIGTRWHWEQEAKEYTVKEDDGTVKSGTSKFNLPTEFLGIVGGDVPTSAGTPSSAASSGSVLDSLGLSEDLVGKLRAARAESSSHGDFLDKAIALDGVVGNDTLVKALADESQLYRELA